ncbi:MAG: proline--tRNA ligase [Candidatus Eisenbacteria bacterium]|uniref:Proline--tRNA ligase n=1 Tax=Eiseniibacteriota bacterium TaxID=2212470 RepID=A0A938BM97_UNCEI|nr:proline--tRNA ligase [Candidatus Eisenbacteria bacterium]
MSEYGITSRAKDFSQWYLDIVLQAELADYSPVRGCMVIRPNGYALWERMQRALDEMIKATGHRNAYFPLFIPESFLKKEAEHVEGFAPECAVVTIGGGARLEEPLMVRPTSETIIYHMYAKWIKSYRDLPLLINQWANVVRWEMRTRLFLRTTEFLWQEGHTAHATPEEAEEETRRMLGVYRDFAEQWMAMPVYLGRKTDREKFAGALRTYSIEAFMQDGRALQAGTSHNLGDNFARAFEVKFQDEQQQWRYCWQTSWGVSTRLIGALIMAHSDDQGLVLPPRLAPLELVVVPIWRSDEERGRVLAYIDEIAGPLRGRYRLHVDDREQFKPGWKYSEWELKGVPLRLEVGPRDVEKQGAVLVRRDTRAKAMLARGEIAAGIDAALAAMQRELFERALERRQGRTRQVGDYAEFRRLLEGDNYFVWAPWCGASACEERVAEETKATIRTVPFEESQGFSTPGAPPPEKGSCLACGEPSPRAVLWAKAY